MPEPNSTLPVEPPPAALRRTALLGLLLALLIAAVYWPVARHGFVNFDDPDYVTSNPRVQAGLTLDSVRWAFTSYHSSNWHPLTWLSHMLDCQFYRLNPAGHHLTNLALHVANSLLLLGLLQKLTGAPWRSTFVAALFAFHPLHVESVAWVAERKDVLSTFFGLLCLWAYARYVEASRSQPQSRMASLRWYLGSLLLLVLGLMSKPMLVTMPCVMLLVDFWPLRRFQLPLSTSERATLRGLLVEKIPFFAVAAASSAVTFLVQRASGAVVPLDAATFELRLANALVAYARYLGKTFWPTDLAVFYPYAPLDWASGQVLGAAALLAAVSFAVARGAKARPWLVMGWLWFLGTLLPVIGLVQVGKQALADRYTYLPHIGLFILLSWGAAEGIARLKWPRLIAATGASLLLASCLVVTARQLTYWRNSKTLFQHAAAVTTGNFVADTVVATVLVEEGKLDEAAALCLRALQLSPGYPEAHNTLGNIYTRQARYEEAAASFRAAIQCDPTFPEPHHGLGNVLLKQGEFREAEAQCREALRLAPLQMPPLYCLGLALHSQGKLDEAIQCYRRLLERDPTLSAVHRSLGNVLVNQGKLDEAVTQFRAALKNKPADGDTHAALGIVLLEQRRPDDALAELGEAARLQPTNAVVQYQLALLRQGRKETSAAVECYRRTLAVQPDWPEALNNLAWILATSSNPSLRDGAQAVTLAERACKLTGEQQAVFIGTLAAAYAEAGRFSEAAASAEKARSLALAAGQKEIAQRNQELLELYRSNRAYHEPN